MNFRFSFARILRAIALHRAALSVAAPMIEAEVTILPHLVRRNAIAIDVGAADGMYLNELRKLTDRVLAFEPNPESASKLRRMFPKAQITQGCLSDRSGPALLRIPRKLDGWGTISPRNTLLDLGPQADIREVHVEANTLDALNLQNVGFIKIDVEGHEAEVLRGAEDTLQRCRPNLLIEVGDEGRGSAPKQIASFMNDAGYLLLRLRDGGLETVNLRETFVGSINVIALPDRGGRGFQCVADRKS